MLGPHPYPLMVREFQSVIGREARAQILAQAGRLPDVVVACVGGGSNAMGIFDAFIDDAGVRMIGVEAGGEAIAPGHHAARFAGGSGRRPARHAHLLLQDEHGNIELTHSVSAGLDYPAVGPEHAWLQRAGPRPNTPTSPTTRRSRRSSAGARPKASCPRWSRRTPSRAHAASRASSGPRPIILVNLSGRGDKDVQTVDSALATLTTTSRAAA